MEPREQRGLIIAATCRLKRADDGAWLVPSQSKGDSVYRVDLQAKTCTCLDHTDGGFTCKHYHAASIVYRRDVLPDGTMIETKTVTTQSLTITERKPCRSDDPAWTRAQKTEKPRVQALLNDLCRNLPARERPASRPGPKPHLPRDAVFAMCYKVYSGFSSRRFSADLLEAHAKGHTFRPIPGCKVPNFFEDGYYTPILKNLIAESARPLKAVETSFAIDSSGFGSSVYSRWFDEKWGVTRTKCVWVKAHVASGTKTHVVTAVRILDKDAADCPQFVPLVKETARSFDIGEVSADKAYISLENFEAVADCGGQAFIAFKSNTTGAVGGLLEKAFHQFSFQRDEYMAHYHKRSNVESTFSAIKRKFGGSVRSRTDTAMVNEVLCKILCHNLTCLVHEQEALGIAPVFWRD